MAKRRAIRKSPQTTNSARPPPSAERSPNKLLAMLPPDEYQRLHLLLGTIPLSRSIISEDYQWITITEPRNE